MATNNKPQELLNVVNKTVQLLEDAAEVLMSTPAIDEQAIVIQEKLWAVNTLKDYIQGLLHQTTDSPVPASIFLFGCYNSEELRVYKTILGNWGLDIHRYYCRGECADCRFTNLCGHVQSAYNLVATYMDRKEVTHV